MNPSISYEIGYTAPGATLPPHSTSARTTRRSASKRHVPLFDTYSAFPPLRGAVVCLVLCVCQLNGLSVWPSPPARRHSASLNNKRGDAAHFVAVMAFPNRGRALMPQGDPDWHDETGPRFHGRPHHTCRALPWPRECLWALTPFRSRWPYRILG